MATILSLLTGAISYYEGCFDDNLDGSGNDRIWPLAGSDPQGKEIDLGNANAPAK